MGLPVVYVRQQGLFPQFLQENNIKSLFQMVQKKRGGGLFLLCCGSSP